MSDNLGIKKTHQLMIDRLIDYINSQYFGDNQLLLNASNELLSKVGNLYQKPYIESAQAYKKVLNGISNSNIDSEVKKFFKELIDNKLGVFDKPFKHQVDALECFSSGKNLFVATGTGSGKTECFLWPMIYKLINEAIHNKVSWSQKGVRTIIVYPMNALVSDQISRLRSIIGDRNNKFIELLHKFSPNSRRPQFGMYTGRTPYAGDKLSKKTNSDIANSYKNSYLIANGLSDEQKEEQRKDIEGLKRINKYPSKNMEKLVSYLENDELEHYDSSEDAELLLRYEMQHNTPDILITNYSMLEYMLIRKIETNIWKDTKEWLNLSKENKLLIIIDEAHMYSGASGGEVALLLRRLYSKLGITHDKIQFIMTSASMPNSTKEDKEYIHKFAESLSGCNSDSFVYLFGDKEQYKYDNEVPFKIDDLTNLQLDSSILNEETINKNIRMFANKIYCEEPTSNPRLWLFNNILRYKPFVTLFENCRGKAVSYDELQIKSIGDNTEKGLKAFENLLLLAPLARDENNNVLFPARIHLFFRGLNGIYACLNPNCECHHDGGGIHLGNLYAVNYGQCPKCHSKIYEILNDRRCGSLFIKTYIHKNEIGNQQITCWSKKGIDENNDFIEYPLYILPDDYDISTRPKNTELAYFDFVSGKLYNTLINDNTCIRVLKSNNFDDENAIFKICPFCGKEFKFIGLSDFKVKGNLPFYNIIKSQFDAQPMTKLANKFTPNGGKKILLFSDSRQSAAILARDMTKISDKESFRKAIYLAMKKIYSDSTNDFSMNYLYPAFIEVCIDYNLRFFYGKELDKFEDDKKKASKYIERCKKGGRKVNYGRLLADLNTPSKMYQMDIVDLFCNPAINFQDLGFGYIAPLDDKLFQIIEELNINGLSKEEYIEIFLAFVTQTCTDSFCFDNTIEENVRNEVKHIKGNRFGFSTYNKYMNEEIKKKYPNDYQKIYLSIINEFFRKEGDEYFLNIQAIKFVLTNPINSKWYICPRCGNIHPFAINGKCSICGYDNVQYLEVNKIRKIEYWRKPVLSNAEIKSVNTEEHTAQLSFKDQKNNTWAKTEDYEMRFQDVNVERIERSPIDILSCTTTMEVGIDIGSLTAIGLRNVPPLRENYQQRAGRAGRRGSSLSTISVYAQGGPHDTYYFNSPEKIINGKLRKPRIDINSNKILSRHFNLVVFTKFFENSKFSLYDITLENFKEILPQFEKYVENVNFSNSEIHEYFIGHNLKTYKNKLIENINFIVDNRNKDLKLFDVLYEAGILPTYSFPMDVISFNIEDSKGETQLAPQRGIDVAISEYAPGRTIVVDKKTYKSGGIYSPIRHKDEENYFKPAEPYFKEENGHYMTIYRCSNPLCGWFSTTEPKDGKCPFCGETLSENSNKKMLIPWGFAPLNAKDIPESEAESEMTYSDEPCYSATPSEDLVETKYINLKISNRKNEEIIILNKGINGNGFDVCRDCGAAQPSGDKTLKENGIGAPFTIKGKKVTCNHKHVEEGVYLGTRFRTDMFFMQVEIDTNKITDNNIILKCSSITLCEALKLASSRVLDISYNDLAIGTRTRTNGYKKFIDFYFYDSLSSGAGYSTQIESYLDEIIDNTYEILQSDDDRDICNFWNQRIQHLFNKDLALSLLNRITKATIPCEFSEEETQIICKPLLNILENEYKKHCSIDDNCIIIENKKYTLINSFNKKQKNEISDFQILEELPALIEQLI